MAYLKNNNNKIVVDAILTEYGKQKLAAQGKLDIYKFAVADDEIDYSLWNENHPNGTDFYNIAITSLPILQAIPGEDLSMKYPLYTPANAVQGNIEEMVLSYDYSITGSKGVRYDREYSIQPSIIPQPGDITRIFYHAYLISPGNLEGAQYKLEPTINQDIGITPDIQRVRDYYARIADGSKYKVGHGFTFRALVPPRTNSIYLTLVIVPHKVNARIKTIKIKLIDRDRAEGYNPGIINLGDNNNQSQL